MANVRVAARLPGCQAARWPPPKRARPSESSPTGRTCRPPVKLEFKFQGWPWRALGLLLVVVAAVVVVVNPAGLQRPCSADAEAVAFMRAARIIMGGIIT